MYCQNCGHPLGRRDTFCPHCGAPVPRSHVHVTHEYIPAASPKSRLAALLLAIFLGELGIHRFYVGKIGTGLIWLFTVGFFGIGWLVDIILIAAGVFRDGRGLPISRW